MAELRKYGAEATIYFPLVDAGAVDFEATPVSFAAGDTQISKDGGAFANTSNNPAHEGNGIYSLVLTSTEMQAAVVVVTVVDSATKAWEDQAIIIDTYGNASAQHAIDLDSTFLTAAQVNAEVDTALSDYDAPTKAELDSGLAGLNDLSAAQVNAEVDTALSDYDPPTKAELDSGLAGLNDPTAAAIRTEIDSNSTQLAAIVADTNELQGDWVNGGRLDLILDELTVQGDTNEGKIDTVDTVADAVLVDTGTTLPAQISGLNNLSAAEVNAEVDTALADYDPPTKAEMDTAFTAIKGATFSGATDSLEAIRDRGDVAWLTGAGGSAPTVEQIRTEIDSNSTQLAAIVADTNELQGDWANGGRLDLILDELTTQGDTNEGKIDTVDTVVDAVLVDTGTTLPAQISGLNDLSAAEVNAEVDTALADYDPPTKAELDSGLAGLNDLSAAEVNAEVDTALADYDAPTKAELDSGLAALNDVTVADILTTQMTESYSADGAAPTLAQALFLIQQQLGDFAISGTTLTVKKIDGSTTAATFTLNDATTPTSVTRAT
jgi:hypothetical protein